jgi:hypothetical protein
VSVDIQPLKEPLRRGDIIQFGAGEYITLAADADQGAITLSTEPLVSALEDADTGYAGGKGGYSVPAGTEVDLLASGKVVPSSLGSAGVTCYGILLTRAVQDDPSEAITGYGIITQGQIYENMLPEATGTPKVLNATHKTELLNRGGAWIFLQYADNTA